MSGIIVFYPVQEWILRIYELNLIMNFTSDGSSFTGKAADQLSPAVDWPNPGDKLLTNNLFHESIKIIEYYLTLPERAGPGVVPRSNYHQKQELTRMFLHINENQKL